VEKGRIVDSDLQARLSSIENMAIPEKDRLLILSTLVELEIVLTELREKERQLLEHQAVLERRVRERTRELEEANDKLQRLASHDPLTGLRNRRMFFHSISDVRNQAERRSGRKLMLLLFIDINNFKQINDSYGHQVGDALLTEAAEIFRRSVRKTDYVFRYGGDEFTIILNNVARRRDGEIVCRKILANIASPLIITGKSIPVSASIGISAYPEDTEDVEQLIQLADEAMYAAKSSGVQYSYARASGQKRPQRGRPA
jgi:diguanylate cyclase (GGDEF)-like protein